MLASVGKNFEANPILIRQPIELIDSPSSYLTGTYTVSVISHECLDLSKKVGFRGISIGNQATFRGGFFMQIK